jgi:hypothetical protein
MRTVYHPDRRYSGYHPLSVGVQPDIDDVAVSFTNYHRDKPTNSSTTILSGIDVGTDTVSLNWGLGDGSSLHSELLSDMLGKRTSGSFMYHTLNLSHSTILHIGAFGYAGSSEAELDLTFLGGFYANAHESPRTPTEPTNKERRLVGKIVLASSLAFMEMDGYSSASLAFEFETSRQYDDLVVHGMLTQE